MAYLKPPGLEFVPDNPLERFLIETYSRMMQTGATEVNVDEDYFFWMTSQHPEYVHNDRKERFERLANRYGLKYERKPDAYRFVFTLHDLPRPVRFVGGPLDGQVKELTRAEMERAWRMPILPPQRMAFGMLSEFDPTECPPQYFVAYYEIQRRGPEDFRYVLQNDEEWAKWKQENPLAPENFEDAQRKANATEKLIREELDFWMRLMGKQPVIIEPEEKAGGGPKEWPAPFCCAPLPNAEGYDITFRPDTFSMHIPKSREINGECVIEIRRLKAAGQD